MGFDASTWIESQADERFDSAMYAVKNKDAFPDLEVRLNHAIKLMDSSARLYKKVGENARHNECLGWIAFWKYRLLWRLTLKEGNESAMKTKANDALEEIKHAIEFFTSARNHKLSVRAQFRKYDMLSIIAARFNKYDDCRQHLENGLTLAKSEKDHAQVHYFKGCQFEIEAWELAYHRFKELDGPTLALGHEIFARIAEKFRSSEQEYRTSNAPQHAISMYAWRNLFSFYHNPDTDHIQSWYAFTSNIDADALIKTPDIERASDRKQLKISIYLSSEDLFNQVNKQYPFYLAMTCVGHAQKLEQWLLDFRGDSPSIDQLFVERNGKRIGASLDTNVRFLVDRGVKVPESVYWATLKINKPFKHGAFTNPKKYGLLLDEAVKNESVILGQLAQDIEQFKLHLQSMFKMSA